MTIVEDVQSCFKRVRSFFNQNSHPQQMGATSCYCNLSSWEGHILLLLFHDFWKGICGPTHAQTANASSATRPPERIGIRHVVYSFEVVASFLQVQDGRTILDDVHFWKPLFRRFRGTSRWLRRFKGTYIFSLNQVEHSFQGIGTCLLGRE